jgi:hypothetical protein
MRDVVMAGRHVAKLSTLDDFLKRNGMKTSRSQVACLLDPKDGNVTPATLQRAAIIVGRKLRLELV